jgi:23S rRNA (guanosine2251-2'-O)-methyltransferase
VHPVTQALLNPERQHKRLLCTQKGFETIEKAYNRAISEGLKLPEATIVEREDLERLLPRDAVHQELVLDTAQLEDVFLTDILNKPDEDSLIVVLDQVTDPHNVGAILRSAAAFGALAVVVQKLNAPEITGTLAKSASGAVEHVPLVREVNLSRAIEQLKESGYFCIGLAERGEDTLAGLKPKGKVAIVLGAEGDGLRRLVAESCDALAKLPTSGEIASLNVSNAAAIALYELVRAKA